MDHSSKPTDVKAEQSRYDLEDVDIEVGDAHDLFETPEEAHHEAELIKRILWKFESTALPILAVLYLCSFLGRTNVCNAKILVLEQTINITDHQYSIGLSVFCAAYIFAELPSNLILKIATPRTWLSILAAIWGIMTMCLGFVSTFASFVTVRLLLGLSEGGLLPGIVLYISLMYSRKEVALRFGLFYTAASLSSAFGGLLARGLNEIGPRGGLEGWRWVLIVEGLMTFSAGVFAFFFPPGSIEKMRSLTLEEKQLAITRLALDNPTNELGERVSNRDEHFNWAEVRRGILDPSVWLTACCFFSMLSAMYSFSLFLPTIVNSLDLGGGPNRAQLLTVPPYACAAALTVVVAYLSDSLALRGVIILTVLPLAIVGYGVMTKSTDTSVQYGMTFLMATGLYPSITVVMIWNSNNNAGHYKRATAAALQLMIANCGGFVASFSYPSSQSPEYHKSHSVILGLLCAAWVLACINVLVCWKIN